MKNFFLSTSLMIMSFVSFGQEVYLEESIDSIFAEWNKEDVPGCALGIIKDGDLIYAKGYGLANMEYDIPNSSSSVFRIGSTSKQFTAACIVLLAEQGDLSLDDNLRSFYPDFPAYAEKITVRHLLNHTSGIRDYLQLSYLKGLEGDDYYVDADIMNWLVNQSDLNFQPGEEFLYSNSGYWLLGQIVNKVSGISMAAYAEKEIFEPLGMDNTHFHDDHTRIVKNRASGYMPDNEGGYRISMTTLGMIGDGGIFTTINDIKKWDDAYYDSSVLSSTFWGMMTAQGVLNDGELIDYAAGLMIQDYKGLKTIRHGGAFVGFRAELLRFPEEKLSIAIFANRGDANPSRMADELADILLKDKLVEEPVAVEEKKQTIDIPKVEFELSQLVGNYEIQPGVAVKLSQKNDSLNVVQSWNKSSYNIVKVKGNTFQIPNDEGLSFTFSDLKDDFTQTLTVLQGGREILASRREVFDASSLKLEDYTGSFYSDELDVYYHLTLEGEVLKLRIGDALSGSDCQIIDAEMFSTNLGMLRFTREGELISGFELDSGRVKNLKFTK